MWKRLCLLLLIGLPAGLTCGCRESGTADWLIFNARVYTLEEAQPWAEAVAIRGDRIVWVGSNAEAEARRAEKTRVIDAAGQLLLPGFIDSHNHIRFGNDPNILNLHDAGSLEEIQRRVREFGRSRPELEWIEAMGWSYSAIPGNGLPTADHLEGLTGGRPAFLLAYDGHTAWLNHAALRLLGLTRGTKLAKLDQVVKDPSSGEPTGVIRSIASLEKSSQVIERLLELLPQESEDRIYQSFQKSLSSALSYGITTIVDPQVSPEALALFERALEEGTLKPRLQIALFHPPGTTEATIRKFEDIRKRLNDDRLRVSAIKLYIDDVIEPHTAAMLEPYADLPQETGETFYPPQEFNQLVARLDRTGFQLFIHSIGDRGIRVALDALEHARRENGPRDSRHQLVHVELLSLRDIPRFKELGVVACMQPRHVLPEGIGRWAAAVGPDRLEHAFAWRSLREAGAVLAFSSDWDVSEMEPLIGIYSAVTRKGLDGMPPGGWVPEQTIDLESAIRAYTLDGAYANFIEENRGSIKAGKYADLILLSDDLFAIQPEKIKETQVVLTMVGGEVVYQ